MSLKEEGGNPSEVGESSAANERSVSSYTANLEQEDGAELLDKVQYQDNQIFQLNKRINELSSVVALIPQLQHQQDQHRKALNQRFSQTQIQERRILKNLMEEVRKILNSQIPDIQVSEENQEKDFIVIIQQLVEQNKTLKQQNMSVQDSTDDEKQILKNDNYQLIDQNRKLKDLNTQLENSSDNEKQLLKKENQELVDQNRKLKDLNTQLENSSDNERQLLKKENQELVDQNGKLKDLNTQLEDLSDSQMQLLKKENQYLVDQNKKLIEESAQTRGSFDAQKNSLENVNQQLINQINKLKDENLSIKEQYKKLQEDSCREKQLLQDENQKLFQQNKVSHDIKIQTVSDQNFSENDNLKLKIKQFTDENQKLIDKIMKLDAELQAESQNINNEDFKLEIKQFTGENFKLIEKITKLDTQLQVESQNIQKENQKQLENQNVGQQQFTQINDHFYHEKQYQLLVDENKNLKSLIQQQGGEIQNLMEQIKSITDRQISNKLESQDQNNDKLVTQLRDEKQNLINQISQLNDYIKAEKFNLNNENLKLGSENQILKFQIEQLTSDQKFVDRKIDPQNKNAVQSEHQNFKSIQPQILKLTQENQNLKLEISKLNTKMKNENFQSKFDNDNLNNLTEQLTSENEFEQVQNSQLDDQLIQDLIKENDKLTSENLNLKTLQIKQFQISSQTENKQLQISSQTEIKKYQNPSKTQQKYKILNLNNFRQQISTGNVENAILVLNVTDDARNLDKNKKKLFSVTFPANKEKVIKNLYVIGPQLSSQMQTSQLIFHVTNHTKFINCEFRNIDVKFMGQNNEINLHVQDISSQFENNLSQQSAKQYQLYGFQFENFEQVSGENIFAENAQNGLRVTKCKHTELDQVNVINSSMEGLGCYDCKDVKLSGINVQNPFLYPSDTGFCYGVHLVDCHSATIQNSTAMKCRQGIGFENCVGYLFSCRLGNCRQGVVLENSIVYKNDTVQMEDNLRNESLCSRSRWMTETQKQNKEFQSGDSALLYRRSVVIKDII